VASSDRLPTDKRTLTPDLRGVKQQDVPRRAARAYKRGVWSRLLISLPMPKIPLQVELLVARGVGEQRLRFCLGQLHLVAALSSTVQAESSKSILPKSPRRPPGQGDRERALSLRSAMRIVLDAMGEAGVRKDALQGGPCCLSSEGVEREYCQVSATHHQ
jgi:hypothetical protein